MNGVTTPFYLHSQHLSTALTSWTVVRSVLLNLLAFVIWAIFGLGLGTLIRSQVTSVVAGLTVYLGGLAVVELIFHVLYYFYRQGWVLGAPVIAPAVASNVMITPGRAFPHAPPQWAGLVIMLGYTDRLHRKVAGTAEPGGADAQPVWHGPDHRGLDRDSWPGVPRTRALSCSFLQ
jgi:hypothetical protein